MQPSLSPGGADPHKRACAGKRPLPPGGRVRPKAEPSAFAHLLMDSRSELAGYKRVAAAAQAHYPSALSAAPGCALKHQVGAVGAAAAVRALQHACTLASGDAGPAAGLRLLAGACARRHQQVSCTLGLASHGPCAAVSERQVLAQQHKRQAHRSAGAVRRGRMGQAPMQAGNPPCDPSSSCARCLPG